MASREFSIELWLFTLGYLAQHVGTGLLIYKIQKQKSIYGISVDTQICYLAATVARMLWITDTKLMDLPFAWVELCIACVTGSFIIY